MSSIKIKLGKRIREIRKSKGYTQEQLAELVGIEPPNLSKIECGAHFPSPEKIERIANILECEIIDLFDFGHYSSRQELIDYISDMVESCEQKQLELIYKFIYNLKLYK